MSTEPARSPGSFHALGERLLRESFPSKDTAAVAAYLEQALARVRRAAGTRPLPTLADIRAGAFDPEALARADLRRADLNGANLRGADLSEANLQGADLNGADLSEAYLREADLRGAYLSGAYLTGVNLRGAKLTEADLSEADLSEADLSGANLRRADLSRANLGGADLGGANLSRANLSEANLVLARWDPKTGWPTELEAWIVGHSEAVSSGGYQVQGAAGADHDLLVPLGF